MEERLEEILRRLEALEQRAHPSGEAPRSETPRCAFCEDERRIVDLIVRLTTENVVRALDDRLRRMPPPQMPPPPHHGPPPGWGHPPQGPHGPPHGGHGRR